MPHKHTRRPGDASDNEFDLAPTSQARSLSVGKRASNSKEQTKSGKKRKRGRDGEVKDDTPREFKRLMQMQAHMEARRRGGQPKRTLDQPSKASGQQRSKRGEQHAASQKPSPTAADQAQITAAAEPAAAEEKTARRPRGLDDPALANRSTALKSITALKQPKTRLQKKIDKKVAAWRATDTKLRTAAAEAAASRREEEGERIAGVLASAGFKLGVEEEEGLVEFGLGGWRGDVGVEERDAGPGAGGAGDGGAQLHGGKKRKGATGRRRREAEDEDGSGKKERRAKWGLGDVAQAPPELKRVREVFKVKKAPAVFSSNQQQGGLKAKADLSEARAEVIRRYREMMGRSGGL